MKTPDTNVLIYAVNADVPQHAKARQWLESAYRDPAGIGFVWVALLGFIRITTRRGILAHPLPIDATMLDLTPVLPALPSASVYAAPYGHDPSPAYRCAETRMPHDEQN